MCILTLSPTRFIAAALLALSMVIAPYVTAAAGVLFLCLREIRRQEPLSHERLAMDDPIYTFVVPHLQSPHIAELEGLTIKEAIHVGMGEILIIPVEGDPVIIRCTTNTTYDLVVQHDRADYPVERG